MAEFFKSCSIDGCNGNAHWRAGGAARGYCSKHYQMWRIHGDPLGGATSPGEARQFLHETVFAYDGDECLIWPYARTQWGRANIIVDGKNHSVSRLVCEDALGPAPTLDQEAAHSCGKGHLGCVSKRHLRWATPTENQADRLVHGTHGRGERSATAKVTEADVRLIRRLEGRPLAELADRFGVSKSSICLIQKRKNWAWLD